MTATTDRWVCQVCGYVHEGAGPPDACPVCGAGPDAFEPEAGEAPAEAAAATPGRYVCQVCGYVHEGDGPPDACPVCGAGPEDFEAEQPESGDSGESGENAEAPADSAEAPDAYLSEWARPTDDFEEKYARVVELAQTGKSATSPMRTLKRFPDWEQILFKGAQLARMPLNDDVEVKLETVIGNSAAKPLVISAPLYVSHMSFGALSREAKIALATGTARVGTMMCSGEGGLLPAEREAAEKYVYELGTAAFSHVDDAIRQADAVEIKIGQAAKPGLGGHLPAGKVTEEIAAIRRIAPGEASVSPGRYTGLEKPEDLKAEVDRVRAIVEGKPVGVKITAGHIEGDLAVVLAAAPDYVTIDCRGGATGSAPTFLKDNVCLPPIYAIHRARRFLDEQNSDVTLCVTGGFRDSADIAKAIAMGADAVALATASLIAIGCQQYRICHTGRCPVGITTQDPALRERLVIEKSAERYVRWFEATSRELAVFARTNGRADIHDLDVTDLLTLSREVSRHTNVEHA